MRRQFLLLIAVATFATTFTANAYGQTSRTVRANVKFDFRIGDRMYPAGEYRIEPIAYNVLKIRSVTDTNKTEFILVKANGRRPQTPRLVFEKYGEDYSLMELFLASEEWGYSISSSRRQPQREKNLASRRSLSSKPLKVVTLLKPGQ